MKNLGDAVLLSQLLSMNSTCDLSELLCHDDIPVILACYASLRCVHFLWDRDTTVQKLWAEKSMPRLSDINRHPKDVKGLLCFEETAKKKMPSRG